MYMSAVATYNASSDVHGVGGLFCERLRSVGLWRCGSEQRDCVFVEKDPKMLRFQGIFIAQVLAFLELMPSHVKYPCSIVSWFSTVVAFKPGWIV